jgi:hypothetical protein
LSRPTRTSTSLVGQLLWTTTTRWNGNLDRHLVSRVCAAAAKALPSLCHELNDYVAVWYDVSNMQKGKVEKDSNLIGWSGAFGPNVKDSAPLAF